MNRIITTVGSFVHSCTPIPLLSVYIKFAAHATPYSLRSIHVVEKRNCTHHRSAVMIDLLLSENRSFVSRDTTTRSPVIESSFVAVAVAGTLSRSPESNTLARATRQINSSETGSEIS